MLCLDKHTTGDGIISALQVLSALRRNGETLAETIVDNLKDVVTDESNVILILKDGSAVFLNFEDQGTRIVSGSWNLKGVN